MARLEMTLTGESPLAKDILKCARSFLDMLSSIEKEQTGKPAKIPWQIDILTGFSTTLIVLRSDAKSDHTKEQDFDTAGEVIKIMERERKASGQFRKGDNVDETVSPHATR